MSCYQVISACVAVHHGVGRDVDEASIRHKIHNRRGGYELASFRMHFRTRIETR